MPKLTQGSRSAPSRARILPLALLLCAFGTPRAAESQVASPPTIAEAIRDVDGDHQPDRLGEHMVLTGVVMTVPREARGRLAYAVLQDATGGVRLLADDRSGLLDGLQPGTIIQASGVLQQYRGSEELLLDRLERMGWTAAPTARPVLVIDLLSERYANRLVRVSGELVVEVEKDGDREYAVRDRSGVIPMRLPNRLRENPELAAQLRHGAHLDVIGIAGQHDREAPFDDGYRLAPREVTDLIFDPVPPYRTIVSGGIIVALALLLFVSWRRRTAAESRAREMEVLTTNLTRSEEALRESEQRHRLLFDRNPHPMWVYDTERLSIIQVNEAAVAHYGYSRAEFLEFRISDLLAPDDSVSRAAIAERALAGGGRRYVGPHRHRKKDGSFAVVEVWSDDAWLAGRPARLVLAHDVTDRRTLEEQLRQAQKMEAVGQLAGGIAHDFNNLITVVGMHAQLLLERADRDPEERKDLHQIALAASRAGALTRQLLAFSRKQLMRPQLLQVNALVAQAEQMFRRVIGEDISISTRLDSSIGSVLADPGQLDQVLMNLVVNARDAMPQGGRLTIETSEIVLDEAYAEHHAAVAPGRYVVIAVSDTGTGMDKATLARVFEPFFTTKSPGQGTGLGLATVYGIVKQSGGYVWVYSEPDVGTTFKIYLPVASAADMSNAAAEPAPSTVPASGRILLVEDEDAVRELARRLLTRQGYLVMAARDGEQALQLASDFAGSIDLLLTDIVMPGINGRALAEQLTLVRPELRVLFTSGYTDDDIIRRGLLSPDLRFLEKPFSADGLARAVSQALEAPTGRAA